MATSFDAVQHFPAAPDRVLAMLQDKAYVEKRCDATGSMRTGVAVTGEAGGTCTVSSTRILPADVPQAAKAFVGETIKVSETQQWQAPAADGSAQASVTVDFGGPMIFTGTITLSPDTDGTAVRTTGEFKATIPFIGGKMEKVAAEQTTRYLASEESVGREWLSQ